MKNISSVVLAALLTAAALAFPAQGPVLCPTGPDAGAYGAPEHYPMGSRATAFDKSFIVATFSHFDTLFPSHEVPPAAQAWRFQRPAEFPEIAYFHLGSRYLLKDYLARTPVTGLLIAKEDQLLYEGYQYDRKPEDRFASQSMVKTIVAMLAGIAISEHSVASIDDAAAKYVPELKNSDYGKITLRDLLHMTSGVTCQSSDSESNTLQTLAQNCKQAVPEGTRFQYSGEDSQVIGLMLARAVKTSLSRYLEEKIWRNIGTESKATWTINAEQQELAHCCFNATLRDYARFARLLAYDGNWNGKQLIPRQWILDATTVKDSDPQLAPGKPAPFYGYGYQIWIFPGPRRMFTLLGANGQRIFVDPESKLIMVQTAVMEKATDRAKDAEAIALWLSLIHQYGTVG